MADNGLGRVFADPPTESDILGLPINGSGHHPLRTLAAVVFVAAIFAMAGGGAGFAWFVLGLVG